MGIMRNDILNNLNNPRRLEQLYRTNKPGFKKAFNLLYPDFNDNPNVQFWNERLNYEIDEINYGTKNEWWWIIIAAVIAGVMAQLPKIVGLDSEQFFTRNSAFIILPILTAYFIWKQKLAISRLFFPIYGLWAALVTFLFPIIFHWK